MQVNTSYFIKEEDLSFSENTRWKVKFVH